jgi:aminoglycoside phosphotransferase family enzyme/predicted kinase
MSMAASDLAARVAFLPDAVLPRPEAQPDAVERTRALVAALASPSAYFHPADDLAVIETHISHVVLAGPFAYKIKKPVRLPFVDYTTLEARRRFCEEEVRLNSRMAPELYLGVVPIALGAAGPIVGGAGKPIEYAVRMQRFEGSAIFDRLAAAGELGSNDIDALAGEIARLHDGARRGPPDLSCGSPETVLGAALDNFRAIRDAGGEAASNKALDALEAWTLGEQERLRDVIRDRQRRGFVRECHGDLHLGNVVRLGRRPVLFDCIEFKASFRWIDVMSDIAFAVMDLHHCGLVGLAAQLLDRYIELTGDYGGLEVLRYYLVYRALVRAKVARIRGRQAGLSSAGAAPEDAAFESYVALAGRLAEVRSCGVVLMRGVSGSGKSAAAAILLERLGGLRLRSDVVRKAAHGLAPLARTRSGLGEGLYARSATERTYEELGDRARRVVEAGYPAIVDATFLARDQRRRFRELARALGVPFAIVECVAPAQVVRERIVARHAAGTDPSEGTLEVLEAQLARDEPPDLAERQACFTCDTSRPLSAEWIAALLARHLRPGEGRPCATSTSSTEMPTVSARFTS